MRHTEKLSHWLPELLPEAGPCAHAAGTALVRSLLAGFTTDLTHLARQVPRETTVKSRRQQFDRWLDRLGWDPQAIYRGFYRTTAALLPEGEVLLLVDFTELERRWQVLQVSFPFEQRALPLYRAVRPYKEPAVRQRELLREMLNFLQEHLPGPRSRYVFVMDRGFPGHWLVKELQARGFRFVLRMTRRWKVTHAEYTGPLLAAHEQPGLVGPTPRLLVEALLGRRGKGANEWSVTHVVLYHGEGRKEPWYLLTSEANAEPAVAIYRQRWQIEGEFRDIKGLQGIDRLAAWTDADRVARFLAWVAVYEWRLAVLWVREGLATLPPFFVKYGRLGWLRVTQEWWRHQQRLALGQALAPL
jgi:hypothetical protein